MQLILSEWTKTGRFEIEIQGREDFLREVDAIRKRRNGWQLTNNGEQISETEAFGASVCFGVFEPSRFNS